MEQFCWNFHGLNVHILIDNSIQNTYQKSEKITLSIKLRNGMFKKIKLYLPYALILSLFSFFRFSLVRFVIFDIVLI